MAIEQRWPLPSRVTPVNSRCASSRRRRRGTRDGAFGQAGGGAGLCLKGRGANGAVPERLPSGHGGCDSGWGRRLLAVENAVGECLWGRVKVGVLEGGGSPLPLQGIPWGGGMPVRSGVLLRYSPVSTRARAGRVWPTPCECRPRGALLRPLVGALQRHKGGLGHWGFNMAHHRPDLPLASARSDVIKWSWVLPSLTWDAACSY